MQKLFGTIFFLYVMALFLHPAKAETYFMKIEQAGVSGQETSLQTCSAKTSPCTFMIPVVLEKGGTKNIGVVMRIKESPYIYLQFYWDQALLESDNFGEEYYTIFAGTSDTKTDPRIIKLYAPIPPEKKPAKSDPVLKYSGREVAILKVHAIKEKESE